MTEKSHGKSSTNRQGSGEEEGDRQSGIREDESPSVPALRAEGVFRKAAVNCGFSPRLRLPLLWV